MRNVFSASTVLALITLIACPIYLSAEEILLSDFENKTVPFAYGTWLDDFTGTPRLQESPNGLKTTEGATAKGGSNDRVSLKLNAHGVIKLKFSVLKGNTADGISVLLEDANNTQAGWHFSTKGMVPGESKVFTSKRLASPDFVNQQGKKLDLDNIVAWHVQGDYSNDEAVYIRFENLAIQVPK